MPCYPGLVDTPMIAGEDGVLSTRAREALRRYTPTAELLQPEQVAAVAVWLSSDAAGAVIGQSLVVAGGIADPPTVCVEEHLDPCRELVVTGELEPCTLSGRLCHVLSAHSGDGTGRRSRARHPARASLASAGGSQQVAF